MIDRVVVDVEIANAVEDTPGGWDATDKLGVAVACVWEERAQRLRVYGPEDLEELRQRLLRAERIDGYNTFNFDFPVIWSCARDAWTTSVSEENVGFVVVRGHLAWRSNDILRRIWEALGLDPDRFDRNTHGGYSLDAVAWHTLGKKKIGHGADAPRWYQDGKIQRVVNYCADDVMLERELADFVDRYGYVISPRTDQRIQIEPFQGGAVL